MFALEIVKNVVQEEMNALVARMASLKKEPSVLIRVVLLENMQILLLMNVLIVMIIVCNALEEINSLVLNAILISTIILSTIRAKQLVLQVLTQITQVGNVPHVQTNVKNVEVLFHAQNVSKVTF